MKIVYFRLCSRTGGSRWVLFYRHLWPFQYEREWLYFLQYILEKVNIYASICPGSFRHPKAL